jgi:hypothetical protein
MNFQAELEHFDFVEPGEDALATMARFRRFRRFNLRELKLGEGATCVWCNKVALHVRRRYCSQSCRDSAFIYSQPHSPFTKAWLLINRQGCACTICGLSYEELLKRKLDRAKESVDRYKQMGLARKSAKPGYGSLGYNLGSVVHCDHIVPISQFGEGFGLANVQVICVNCHITKTANERYGQHVKST